MQRAAGTKINHAQHTQHQQARDAFYQCMKECGLLYSSKTPIPSKCQQLRAKFEGTCLPSWVSVSSLLRTVVDCLLVM